MFSSVFKKSFDSVKCNTLLRLATSRIKLLRNKRDVYLKQLKRDLAKLLETKQEPRAHIQVENIYREQNIMAAYDIIELLCDLLAARMPILVSQKQCPADLREAVATIIFAAPRCSDIPELQKIRHLFTGKYGKEFTAVAADLRPDCGVNRVITEKLSIRAPSIETKLKLMKDIATEQGLDWDLSELASQNLSPPEDLLDGPAQFFESSQMSVQNSFKEPIILKPISPQQQRRVAAEPKRPVVQNMDFLNEKQYIPFVRVEENISSSRNTSSPWWPPPAATRRQSSSSCDISSHNLPEDSLLHKFSTSVPRNNGDKDDSQRMFERRTSSRSVASAVCFSHINEDESQHSVHDRRTSLKDVADAARAAAEFAEQAASAAQAAALLASKRRDMSMERLSSDSESDNDCDDEASQHSARFEDRPDDSSTLRMPIFDEEISDGEKSPRMRRESGEIQYDSREEFLIFDTDVYSQPRANQGRHMADQADQSELVSRNSSSKHCRGGPYNANVLRYGSVGAAGSASEFEWGNKPEDQAPQSRPPKRPPPRVPGAQHPTLTKSTTFVHPKLPDCDEFFAHFQALKALKSKN